MADPVYDLGIEFVAGSYTNITDRMLTANINRKLGGAFLPFGEGVGMFVLDNHDAALSPYNTAGPYAPNVKPGKEVRLLAANGNRVLHSDVGTSQHFILYASASFHNINGPAVLSGVKGTQIFDTSSLANDSIGQLIPVSPGRRYTFSFYVKHGTTTPQNSVQAFKLYFEGSGDSNAHTNFDLSLESISGGSSDLDGNPIYRGIENVGGGWYRVWSSSYNYFGSSMASFTIWPAGWQADGAAVGDLFITGLQVEEVPDDGYSYRPTRYTPGTDTRTFHLFHGTTRKFTVDPFRSSRVTLEAVDPVSKLRNKHVDTDLLTDTNPGSVFTQIFSQTAVSSTDISSFTHTIPFVWYDDKSALNAVSDLLRFGHYWIYARGDGVIYVRNQNWQLEANAAASLQEFYGLNYALDPEAVMNDVKIRSQPRKLSSSVQTVAWLEAPLALPASGSTSFWLSYVDPANPLEQAPAKNLITPVSSTDYQTSTQSGGGGTDTTATTSVSATFFGASALCTVFNGYGATSYLNKFQLRGNSIQRQPRIAYATESSSSQAEVGDRSVTVENDFIGTYAFAQNLGDFLLDRYKDTFPDVVYALKNEFPEVLQRDLGDTVHVTESITAIGNKVVITSVDHTLDRQRGLEHVVRYGIDMRTTVGFLILDDASYGKLDERRLGF